MEFREGEHICITLVFGFGYDCEFGPFSRLAEQNLSQIGDADAEWPDYFHENGFTAGNAYEIPVEIKVYDDFDEDSVRYMLKKFRKQVTESGINIGLLEIRKGNETIDG